MYNHASKPMYNHASKPIYTPIVIKFWFSLLDYQNRVFVLTLSLKLFLTLFSTLCNRNRKQYFNTQLPDRNIVRCTSIFRQYTIDSDVEKNWLWKPKLENLKANQKNAFLGRETLPWKFERKGSWDTNRPSKEGEVSPTWVMVEVASYQLPKKITASCNYSRLSLLGFQ